MHNRKAAMFISRDVRRRLYKSQVEILEIFTVFLCFENRKT